MTEAFLFDVTSTTETVDDTTPSSTSGVSGISKPAVDARPCGLSDNCNAPDKSPEGCNFFAFVVSSLKTIIIPQ